MIIRNLWKISVGIDTINTLNNERLSVLAREMQTKHQLANAEQFYNRKRYNCFIEYKHEDEIKKLGQLTIKSVRNYLYHLYDEKSPYELEILGWSMVQKWGEFVVPHHHVGHHLSAVFYVDVPSIENSPIKNSGAIVFNNPAPMARSWIVRSEKSAENNLFTVQVQTNNLLIFPSYLVHSVNPWFGRSERIAYAMNLFVKRDIDFEEMLNENDL